MVKRKHAADALNYLVFTAGSLQQTSNNLQAAPRIMKDFRAIPFEATASREAAAAWALSARCRIAAYYNRGNYGGGEGVYGLDIHTWIIGPSTTSESPLTSWFAKSPDDYRLVLHRSPLQWAGKEISPLPWASLYDYRPRIIETHRHFSQDQHAAAERLLTIALRAYQKGAGEFSAYLQQTGHPYWFSDGRPGNS